MIDKDIANNIRAEIAATIVSDSTIFGEVSAFPKVTFADYPAVVVMPSENLADWGSSANDKLTFVFTLHVFYPAQSEGDQEKTELAVGEAVGELLRIFSQKGKLTTCLWVQPVPSAWGTETIGEAVLRTALVTLSCITYPVVN